MSADYAIAAANRYACELLGRDREDLVGHKFSALLSGAARIFAMTRLQQELALAGRVDELALDVTTPAGLRVPVMLNAAQDTAADGRPGLIRLALWRAAAQRAYEAQVPIARQAAADAARVKSDFLANISHEIRTPLNGVVAAADLLAETAAQGRDRELVEMIQGSASLAVRLLSDILDVSKVQSGVLTLEQAPFEPGHALEGVLAIWGARAREKGLAFAAAVDLPGAPWFRGDAVRLRQIVGALLSNAVKFTEAGRVLVRLDRAADGALTLTVEDTGAGIGEADQARLFEAFEQAERGLSRTAGGAGLGLALCRGLTALMGGSVEVESEPGRGSRFVVRLPLEEVAAPPAPATAAEPAATRRLRILLVEDNPTNRRVVELILQAFEVDLVMAENGADGVAAWRDGAFDVVLMDLQMPVMDGLTAIREIRRLEAERPGGARTPVAVLSANAMSHHRAEAIAAGADLHLAKPITPPALLEGIQAALAAA
jgi:signal transduction histidine kinase/CheY-like chemotaxis protein